MTLRLTKTSDVDGSSPLSLFNETPLKVPLQASEAETLLREIEAHEECSFAFVELVFVNEAEITGINREYLGTSGVTDIISFRYDEKDSLKEIEGTLYCCAPRIVEQAEELGEDVHEEFRRVYIHGLLHLAGYRDHTPDLKKAMSRREDFYLAG